MSGRCGLATRILLRRAARRLIVAGFIGVDLEEDRVQHGHDQHREDRRDDEPRDDRDRHRDEERIRVATPLSISSLELRGG